MQGQNFSARLLKRQHSFTIDDAVDFILFLKSTDDSLPI
jgi:hypothetical protein